MSRIDDKIARLGYALIKETKFGAYYEKEDEFFTHEICVMHKVSGSPIIQSYDSKVYTLNENGNKEYICSQCGFEVELLPLLYKKYKELKRKYNWGK